MVERLTLAEVVQRTGLCKREAYRIPCIAGTRPRRWSTEAVDAWLRGEV